MSNNILKSVREGVNDGVQKIKTNEDVSNAINSVGENYNKLLKKQKGHIVEFVTIAAICLIVGLLFGSLLLVVLAVGVTLYVIMGKNRLVELWGNMELSESDLKVATQNYNKGVKEALKKQKNNIAYTTDAYQKAVGDVWGDKDVQIVGNISPNFDATYDAASSQSEIGRKALMDSQTSYNSAVQTYNNYILSFPSSILAYIWGYQKQELIGEDNTQNVRVLKEEAELDTSDIE